jgi:hypothetical protein
MSEIMTWDEAVALIMKNTGKNRRQARTMLVQALHEGKLPGYVEIDGQMHTIPRHKFPAMN